MASAIRLPREPVEASASLAPSLLAQPSQCGHLVQFYKDDDFLFATVARFFCAGLRAGDQLVAIVTEPHRERFLAHLHERDSEGMLAQCRLTLLDARETLAEILVDDMPDPGRFQAVIGPLLNGGPGRESNVRVFGEMVDVLFSDDASLAAIRLEELWSEARKQVSFLLLCAYSTQNFRKEGDAERFLEVCRVHSQVIPTKNFALLDDLEERFLEISRLERRAPSLEGEIDERSRLERSSNRIAHARLNETETRFRLLVESVEDYAVFMLDPTGHVSTWNLGAERIKGYSAGEIIGKHFSTFYRVEDIAGGKCELELEIAKRDGRFEDEGWRVRKDGSLFWANVVITALRDETATLVGFAKVTRDLTDRVRAEQERLELARLEEAERQKDDFLAIMGHELRNPLAPMVTALHLIKLRGGRASDKEIAVLDRQLQHMKRLVEDLLDVSRVLRDKLKLSTQAMEIAEVLASAVHVASPLIEDRLHHLTIDVPARGLLVSVDLERMTQVFGDILNNAAKYTEKGGHIRLRAASTDGMVEVTIEDTGQGIKPELLGRVFELFTQGDQGLERGAGGLGIGLAIARRLVRQHGGEIGAASDGPGRGSRFTVRLPGAFDGSPEISASRPSPLQRGTARRVLVVDDNVDSAEMMQMYLQEIGHDVRIALDGHSAVKVCHEFEPDAVFLDIGLPGMNGYEVAALMRKIPFCEKIPIIAISGYAREGDRARALKAGFSDHVPKPIDMDRLERFFQSSTFAKD